MSGYRSEPRSMCADMVGLHWRDRFGWNRRSTALLEDISRSGASLHTDEPIPPGTCLRMAFPKGRLVGSVRYCFFRDIGYCIGMEFAEDSKWSQRRFRPRHLLDLTKFSGKPAGKVQ